MSRSPGTSIIPTAMVKTMPASTQRGRYCSGPVRNEQHQQHDAGEDELRELAAGTGALGHGGLGRAAVDDEGPAQRRRPHSPPRGRGCRRSRRRARDGARRRRATVAALCAMIMTKHDAATGSTRERFAPGHVGQAERRQPARHRTDDGDAVPGEVEGRARRDRSHHHERARSAAAEQGDGRARMAPATRTDSASVGRCELRQARAGSPRAARACVASARRRRACRPASRCRPGRRRP